jgi:hypothetical protein
MAVKYKTGEEVKAALLELLPILNANTNAALLISDKFNAIDPAAPNAEEQRQALRTATLTEFNGPDGVSTVYNSKIIPLWQDIRDSAAALPKSDPALFTVIRSINGDFTPLVSAGLDAVNNIPDSSARLKQKIIAAKATSTTTEDVAPASTASAPPTSDTATNQVVNSATPTAGQASTPAPASPAPSVPENQLSTTQKINLIKNQTDSGGETAANQTAPKSELAADQTKQNAQTLDDIDVTAARLRPNPLHAYPSYTYGLSLHLMSVPDYNNLVETGEYSPKNVLIASAGRYNTTTEGKNSFVRNPAFSDDFYFENLNLLTIIGVGERTRATNAIESKFTIVEPYGLTFLDRLLEASKALNIANYLQNPYMLQIDFYGTDDEGNILHPIPNITKNIPIRMLSCSASVSTRGSEYQIQAVPFNHQAFDHIVAETPINIEVTAGTVAGFFKSTISGTDSLARTINTTNKEREESRTIRTPDGKDVPAPTALISTKYTQDPTYKTNSYGDAINAYVKQVELNHNQIYSDRYEFVFDPEIGDATIIDNMPAPNETPLNDLSDLSKSVRSSAGMDVASLDKSQVVTAINYGTSIDAVLGRIIRNSSYIRNQLAVLDTQTNQTEYKNKKEANEDKPLKWFKIIPSVKLIGFDPFINMFARQITYHVVPYEIRNVRLDDAPKAKAKSNQITKIYNYMYTGENDDIIDLKIEFNSMYYTSITAYRSNNMFITGKDSFIDNIKGTCDVVAPPDTRTTIQPTQRRYRLTDQRDVAASRAKSATEIAAADLERSLTVEATADMLSVTIKIIGDPEFIKQDDLFYSPKIDENGNVVRETAQITPNGSVRTDTGEVYVRLIIKTPTDIDDATGMMAFGEKSRTSGFSGVYRVFQVENEFSKGQFSQVLTLIRQPDQEAIDNKKKDSEKERSETAHWNMERIANQPDPEPAPEQETPAMAEDDTTEPVEEPTPLLEPTPADNQEDLANIRENGPETEITSATESPEVVIPDQTFAQAFREARSTFGGPGGVFTWRGKEYQTNIVGEDYVTNPKQVY